MSGVSKTLKQLFETHQPDIVLMFGLASRTHCLRIETRARNARSALFPDAEGARGLTSSILVGAPREMRSRAPHKALLRTLQQARVPARLSRDAGRYVCNLAYWHALSEGSDLLRAPLVQFVHVPKVASPASRQPPRRKTVTMMDLVRAGESLLLALVPCFRSS